MLAWSNVTSQGSNTTQLMWNGGRAHGPDIPGVSRDRVNNMCAAGDALDAKKFT